jgi:hypothetical protein
MHARVRRVAVRRVGQGARKPCALARLPWAAAPVRPRCATKRPPLSPKRVEDLSNGQHRFKVDVNAKENHMSGEGLDRGFDRDLTTR